jgi:predicted nucleotidyltransferase component of viral defense system
MRISKEKLFSEAEATGFRAEVLEKVIHLLNLLEGLRSHTFLRDRIALKGGTALNLFVFNLPRLSVDIDLNYIGACERERMLAERPKIEKALQDVCGREGLVVRRIPEDHAGGKWPLRYESAVGMGGNLEVDLNFMFRLPLYPVVTKDSNPVGSYKATEIPVLDIHELAAGKLTALLARHQARDLFDTRQILNHLDLDRERLRLAFVIYGAMNRKDWRAVSVDDVGFETGELENHLIPLLRRDSLMNAGQSPISGSRLVEECRQALQIVLPLSKSELEFLDLLLDTGKINPSLLTSDNELAERIKLHPMLEWKALNVRKYKRL